MDDYTNNIRDLQDIKRLVLIKHQEKKRLEFLANFNPTDINKKAQEKREREIAEMWHKLNDGLLPVKNKRGDVISKNGNVIEIEFNGG